MNRIDASAVHSTGTPRRVVFVCLHGAAKSIIAAAYCERLAARRGLDLRATAAGLEPDAAVPPPVLEGLLAEGIDVRGHLPRRVTREELTGAWRVVAIGCDLGPLVAPGLLVERWDDLPSAGDDFPAARDRIITRLSLLLDHCHLPEARDE
jgi:hypothetical protein